MEKKGLRDQLEAQAREIARLQGEAARWLTWVVALAAATICHTWFCPGHAGPRQSLMLCMGLGMQCCSRGQRQEQCRALCRAIGPSRLLPLLVRPVNVAGPWVTGTSLQRSTAALPRCSCQTLRPAGALSVATTACWLPSAVGRGHVFANRRRPL